MDDMEIETLAADDREPPPEERAPSINVSTASPIASRAAKDKAAVQLGPSEPYLKDEQEDQPSSRLSVTATGAISSGASILSASPTLLSNSSHQRRTSSVASHQSLQLHQQIQHNTSALTLEAARPPSPTSWLDPEHFDVVFRELTKYSEQMELLNDQILEAMTLYQPLSAPTPTLLISPAPAFVRGPASPEETRRRVKGKEKAVDLEEDRFCVAQSFADIAMDSWPRIYKIPPEPRTALMTKHRIKIAIKLKNAIVAFWSAQSHFQEQAQLILDVYQDPAELECGNRIRMLKSRHLNNLLSQEPLDPHDIRQLLEKYGRHQDKMAVLSDQLQSVWLGILMLLADPDQKQSSKLSCRLGVSSMHLPSGGASSSSSYYLDPLTPPLESSRGLFHLSRNKQLGLKVTVLLAVGAGMIAMALVLNTR
ncbi:hypothetical protein EDD21DRAFT_382339 [Dissophora ornata]|nr:hypothetical protein EDD21DRAFT_382339 [Dissophora ornata]